MMTETLDSTNVGLARLPGANAAAGVICLANGDLFDVYSPDPNMVSIGLIAESLSKLCRYTGQCVEFYSVAQHSVICCEEALRAGYDLNTCMAVFLHDAAESITGDISRPIKALIKQLCGNAFKEVEQKLGKFFFDRFDIHCNTTVDAVIHRIDNSVLRAEAEQLCIGSDKWNFEDIVAADVKIVPLDWHTARELFLDEWDKLQAMKSNL